MRFSIEAAALAVYAAVPSSVSAQVPAASSPVVATDGSIVAATPQAGFHSFLEQVRARALGAGVSAATLDAVLPTLTYNPRVIELDQAQPGGPSNAPIPMFAPYKATHVDSERINRGRSRYQSLRPRLGAIEAATGVPLSIMVAIYGHETNYGSYTGDFDLIRSLASLAYEGRRRQLFTNELIAALQLIDQGIPRGRLKGSWAGATGYPQFLPTVYMRLSVDADGDGRKDIWSSETDALGSIANYLVNAGWKRNLPWGVAVRVPDALNRSALRPLVTSPRCPRVHDRHSRWLTIGEWRRLGVTFLRTDPPPDEVMATLLEPDGPGATAYLLTGNYRVILDYNCSNFYALSVGLLADEVAR